MNIKFIYAIKEAEQTAFDGINRKVAVYATRAHIVYQGSVMCGTDKGKLQTKHGSNKVRETKHRPDGLLVCEECEKLFKANGQLNCLGTSGVKA